MWGRATGLTAVSINLAFTATGNSHAIWDHTVLPTTRQW